MFLFQTGVSFAIKKIPRIVIIVNMNLSLKLPTLPISKCVNALIFFRMTRGVYGKRMRSRRMIEAGVKKLAIINYAVIFI